MRFFHVADVHLGVEPDAGFPWSRQRKEQVWDTFREVIALAGKEKPELLLIAGDFFHRQPLLRELKEVNYLFSTIPDTVVVLIAGNHDYVKKDSFYRSFTWEKNVIGLFGSRAERVEIPGLDLAVYGFSYDQREILEERYRNLRPGGSMRYHILVAHGGDSKHIPWQAERLAGAGFDYIACGHIHKPQLLVSGKMAYAGALEPTDLTQMGPHGFVRGTLDERGTRLEFVPFAHWEYVPVVLSVTEKTTQYALEQELKAKLDALGKERIALVTLQGERAEETEFSKGRLMDLGNVMEVRDNTRPCWELDKLKEIYRGSLIGSFIEHFEGKNSEKERRALEYGLEALMEARRDT